MNAATTITTALSNDKLEAASTKAAKAQASPQQLTIIPNKREKPMATDFTKLSRADAIKRQKELQEEMANLEAAIAAGRDLELATLAKSYVEKCAASGFSAQEAVNALKPFWHAAQPKERKARKPKSSPKVERQYKDKDTAGARPEINTKYKFADSQTWETGPQLRRTPDWVIEKLSKGETWAKSKVK